MNLEICRGTPQYSGRYVCYMPGLEVPTVLRLWIPELGWCDLGGTKNIAGNVAGWIGPLPVFPENSVKLAKPTQEFDL